MLCSAIIPTVGRQTLSRAVQSVLTQTMPDEEFELIVINDSGKSLPPANWQQSAKVRIVNTNKRERSIARNTGAAIARGQYLHFLDDDDWLVPGAYSYFWELSRGSNAKWLYGVTQLVDRQNRPTIQLKHALKGNCFVHALAGEWIPLQSSWIERETFMQLGGFNPFLSGPEDIDILRRFLLITEVDETPHVVANVVMRGAGSTTDYNRHPQASRWARESLLDRPDVHHRMQASADNPFWQGRILRVYLTSVVWNIQHLRLSTAASRTWSAVRSGIHMGTAIFAKDFWRAVSRPYASITFANGIQESRRIK